MSEELAEAGESTHLERIDAGLRQILSGAERFSGYAPDDKLVDRALVDLDKIRGEKGKPTYLLKVRYFNREDRETALVEFDSDLTDVRIRVFKVDGDRIIPDEISPEDADKLARALIEEYIIVRSHPENENGYREIPFTLVNRQSVPLEQNGLISIAEGE